jgi:hypothetical protein
MSELSLQRIRDFGKSYAMKAVDVVYQASTFSIIAYGMALLFLIVIGLAVTIDVINVPFIHAK